MRGKAPWIATSCSAAIFLLALVPLASARNNFRTTHRFKGQPDGASPFAGLISDSRQVRRQEPHHRRIDGVTVGSDNDHRQVAIAFLEKSGNSLQTGSRRRVSFHASL